MGVSGPRNEESKKRRAFADIKYKEPEKNKIPIPMDR